MIPAIKAAPMMDLAELVRVVGGAAYGPSVRFAGVSTDSRSVSASDLFVALKGERFDGHDFVAQALGRGALAALTSRRV
ncbi:MAG TPA: Mur ligase domain-containing protein, partial [Usitatibacter sp.]|nr:Mur ligase domain-containing protein [Usitatibacter sp.]